MMLRLSPVGAEGGRLVPLLGIGLLGIATVPLATAFEPVSPRLLLAGIAGLAGVTAVVLAGRLKPVLLALFVVALTYNRQYYSFDWLHGDLGGRGLYWCPADVCLVGLLLLWPVERALRLPAPRPPRAGPVVWLLPLMAVGLLSAACSAEPVGSTVEIVRYLKLALLLLYLRYNLDARGFRVIVAALAGVILLQTPISILQAAFASGQNGLSQIFQTSEPSELARRAAGTLGHPNYLAPYLLLITPPFIAVALGLRGSWIGTAAALVAASGSLTIALTQSRGPIALLLVTILVLIALMTLRRALPALRAVGLIVAGAVLLVAVVAPLAPAIEKRLSGDFGASVDFRAAYNDAAVRMWEASPMLGVGPNNFGLEIRHYSPDLYVVMALDALSTDEARSKVHLRSTAPVHNVYLFVLSELGILGLICFLLFLLRGLVLAWRASAAPPSVASLFALGLFCGLLAEYAQQLIDYSLLWDPLLFTITLLMGLMHAINAAQESSP
ncbi:O-antigen ligase family protein [Methylobacterium nodulans]|uniref:O-antigen polymerase n=1 Tax=Methylobacterium nodulans (strain LMG 21967 / CNCM I-2342 / ORS 2060) TaxID=460265 RepID=B8IJR1_METNO|nr:O-antigen ligase family protein [Methylobacterium nodulans]ACL58109.1 O-antigen polymerase [Methylobacterium nodulans ORS 2060]